MACTELDAKVAQELEPGLYASLQLLDGLPTFHLTTEVLTKLRAPCYNTANSRVGKIAFSTGLVTTLVYGISCLLLSEKNK